MTLWALDPKQKNLEIIEEQKTRGKVRYMKVLDKERIIGFTVDSGPRGATSIRPIYEVTIYLKASGGRDKDTHYIFTSHRVGDRLAGYTYDEDVEGVTLASIAGQAIGYLVRRSPRMKKARDKHEKHILAVLNSMVKPEAPKKKKGKKR